VWSLGPLFIPFSAQLHFGAPANGFMKLASACLIERLKTIFLINLFYYNRNLLAKLEIFFYRGQLGMARSRKRAPNPSAFGPIFTNAPNSVIFTTSPVKRSPFK